MALYWILHRLLPNAVAEADFRFASNMAFRVSTVYALVLSLAFSTTLADFDKTEQALNDEIVVIGTLLNMYRQLDEPESVALISEYTIAVFESKLERSAANWGRSDSILDKLYERTLIDLRASKVLAASALNSIESARALRIQRIYKLRQGLPWYFWFFSIAGLVVTLYAMSGFEPNIFRMGLVLSYGALVTLVIYMIYEMATPYAGLYQLDWIGFQEIATYIGVNLDMAGAQRASPSE